MGSLLTNAPYWFVVLLAVLGLAVAYTGMRRSSMLLSRVDEVDSGLDLVFVRSRKFERGLTESRLEVRRQVA